MAIKFFCKCGKKLKLRMGKNGLFIACSGYLNCTFTENIPDPDEDVVDATELESTMWRTSHACMATDSCDFSK